MEAERWGRVKQLFEAALALPAEERAGFLATACGGDEDLRTEVESLLAQAGSTQGFLAEPLFERRDPTDEGMERERIGPYRLLRRLGQGGMGAVYLAARDDDEFQHQVAIKLIKRGMDTDEVVHRFRYERQILADLQHPQIARLYDGGSSDDGLPYFVMEHVDGQPIDRYCAEHQLDLRQRLGLFRDVCEAVDFAHRNLVVHRDLKPANILITTDGTPKLLDFGIARLLAPAGADPTQTVFGGRFFTPSYASPEQIRGEVATLATDVYSLGVVLYELLTGERPFADRDSDLIQLDRATLDREPRRPSSVARRRARTSDGSATVPIAEAEPKSVLGRRLAGDLDAIVLKAMRSSPRDRYRSAAELGEDVGRYLEGRPVEARQGSQLYLVGKFLRRHRVAAAVMVLAVGLLLSWLLVWSAKREGELAQLRSETEAKRAEALKDFLITAFQNSDPRKTEGKDLTASQILAQAPAAIGKSLDSEPETRAALLSAIGEVHLQRGEYDAAVAVLKKSCRLRHDNLGPSDARTLRSRNNLAAALRNRGDYALAEIILRDVVSLLREHHPENLEDLAIYLNNLATTQKARGDRHGAVRNYRETLKRKLDFSGGRDSEEIANGFHNLAVALADINAFEEAEGYQRQALEMYERLDHPEADTSRSALGLLICKRGRPDEGEEFLKVSLVWRQKTYATQPEKIVIVMRNRAFCREQAGDLDEAEGFLRDALARLHAQAPGSSEIAKTEKRLEELLLKKNRLVTILPPG